MDVRSTSAPLDLDQFQNFTPGPWHFEARPCVVIGPSYSPVATPTGYLHSNDVEGPEQQRANAALIAAAPALLAECKRQREEIARLRESVRNQTTPHCGYCLTMFDKEPTPAEVFAHQKTCAAYKEVGLNMSAEIERLRAALTLSLRELDRHADAPAEDQCQQHWDSHSEEARNVARAALSGQEGA